MPNHEAAAGVDVIVVGGGAAGLAAALLLGRSRRSVLVIDAGEPRNAPADHVHGYLGREGTPPSDLLAIGRSEVAAYGVEVREGLAVDAHRHRDGTFVVELAGGEAVSGRRLLVATGGHDELPAIPGVAERWGRDVIHCPYCHGWEVRDRSIVVISTNGMGVHGASLFRQLSDDVTLVVHAGPGPTEAERAQLTGRGVRIVVCTVAELVVTDGRLTGVRLDDGSVLPAAAAVVSPRLTARADLLAPLGLEPVEGPTGLGTTIPADATGATGVPGVYVAGNVGNLRAHVLQSAAEGAMAGAAINADLVTEDLAAAAQPAEGGPDERPVLDEAFWEDRYRSKAAIWSGQPNAQLVADIADLQPGTALDVGAGEGADAIWLAQRGWRVVAVDISSVALDRGRRQAEELGLADQIGWVHLDVTAAALPPGPFDLVSAQFVHFPPEHRGAVYTALADAVAPGGTLMIVGHHPSDLDAGIDRPRWPELFFTADELTGALGRNWTVIAADARRRQVNGSDGAPVTICDAVLVARRTGVTPTGRSH